MGATPRAMDLTHTYEQMESMPKLLTIQVKFVMWGNLGRYDTFTN
jgi:hypothetical protein